MSSLHSCHRILIRPLTGKPLLYQSIKMTSSKRFFLSLVPPLFLSAYYRLRRKNIKPSPAWHTVKSGPSMGTELFVDTQNESFAEMTEGSYDNFLWQYLSGQTIRGEYIVDIGAHIGYHTLALVKYLDDV